MTQVAILGASNKPHRYAYKAQMKLQQHGFAVLPVAKKGGEVNGISCVKSLAEISQPVDTVTLYINPDLLREELAALIKLNPRRVVFNPGTEDDDIIDELKTRGISVVEDCTLIMLDAGRF